MPSDLVSDLNDSKCDLELFLVDTLLETAKRLLVDVGVRQKHGVPFLGHG